MSENDFLLECEKVLVYFGKDLNPDVIMLDSGDFSCIMNKNSEFYELFGGNSIWSIAAFYAEKKGKKIKFKDEWS